MKSLLEELYCQKFGLKNDSVLYQKELRDLSSLIEKNASELKARLDVEEQEIFDKYLECTNERSSLERYHEFLTGFRLGGRMIMEIIFGADDSELQD